MEIKDLVRETNFTKMEATILYLDAGGDRVPTLVYEGGLGAFSIRPLEAIKGAYKRAFYNRNFRQGVKAKVSFEIGFYDYDKREALRGEILSEYLQEIIRLIGTRPKKEPMWGGRNIFRWFPNNFKINRAQGSVIFTGMVYDGSENLREGLEKEMKRSYFDIESGVKSNVERDIMTFVDYAWAGHSRVKNYDAEVLEVKVEELYEPEYVDIPE